MTEATFSIELAAHVLGAQRIGPEVEFRGCAIDTRTILPGQLFVALRGERLDGHEYVSAARARGAAAALVERVVDYELPCLLVPDVRLALGRLAAHWRNQFAPQVIAVTGSNGKTTVKELVGSIARNMGPALVTAGNLNNDLGLPMTLLQLTESDRYAVLELGANHAGEIANLAAIATPHVGVITHCGPAHLEGFGSIEGVARAKGELLEALPEDGYAILNADDRFLPLWRDLAQRRNILTFGLKGSADVHATWRPQSPGIALEVSLPDAKILLESPLLGEHNVMNVLASVAAAWACNMSPEAIRSGIAQVHPVPGRLCPIKSASGALLIDDSYNANPASLSAALAVLSEQPGAHWLVLGDMAELGPESDKIHQELGSIVRESGVNELCTLGSYSASAARAFGQGARHFDDREKLIDFLATRLTGNDTVLVKGSRSMAMDSIVDALALEVN